MSDSSFPWYFTINDRPVQVIATADGGMDVLIFSYATGELEQNLSYLSQCFEPGKDVKRVSEEEFTQQVAALRAKLDLP